MALLGYFTLVKLVVDIICFELTGFFVYCVSTLLGIFTVPTHWLIDWLIDSPQNTPKPFNSKTARIKTYIKQLSSPIKIQTRIKISTYKAGWRRNIFNMLQKHKLVLYLFKCCPFFPLPQLTLEILICWMCLKLSLRNYWYISPNASQSSLETGDYI